MSLNPENENKSAPAGALFLILALAGLAGAAGVALAAVAAHKVDSPALATAATMLMIHATAVIGLLALTRSRAWLAAAGLMLAAASLFSGDIALHTLADTHIFPMAAPIGGSLLIASWLAVAVLAATAAYRAR